MHASVLHEPQHGVLNACPNMSLIDYASLEGNRYTRVLANAVSRSRIHAIARSDTAGGTAATSASMRGAMNASAAEAEGGTLSLSHAALRAGMRPVGDPDEGQASLISTASDVGEDDFRRALSALQLSRSSNDGSLDGRGATTIVTAVAATSGRGGSVGSTDRSTENTGGVSDERGRGGSTNASVQMLVLLTEELSSGGLNALARYLGDTSGHTSGQTSGHAGSKDGGKQARRGRGDIALVAAPVPHMHRSRASSGVPSGLPIVGRSDDAVRQEMALSRILQFDIRIYRYARDASRGRISQSA